MNRENLAKLADYLDALPDNYKHFEMRTFRRNGENIYEATTKPIGCETVACAVGHAPFALPDLPPLEHETWEEYSARVLIDYKKEEARWEWCFGGGWDRVDNTPRGAAARIRYLLEKGRVPNNWAYQQADLSPLSYSVAAA